MHDAKTWLRRILARLRVLKAGLPAEQFDNIARRYVDMLREGTPRRTGRTANRWRVKPGDATLRRIVGAPGALRLERGGTVVGKSALGLLIPIDRHRRGSDLRGDFITVRTNVRGLRALVFDRRSKRLVAVRKQSARAAPNPYLSRVWANFESQVSPEIAENLAKYIVGG